MVNCQYFACKGRLFLLNSQRPIFGDEWRSNRQIFYRLIVKLISATVITDSYRTDETCSHAESPAVQLLTTTVSRLATRRRSTTKLATVPARAVVLGIRRQRAFIYVL